MFWDFVSTSRNAVNVSGSAAHGVNLERHSDGSRSSEPSNVCDDPVAVMNTGEVAKR